MKSSASEVVRAGYFPLSVGRTWDYVRNLHDFPAPEFRRTVEKDTVIGDLTFSKIKHVDFVAVIMGGVAAVDSSYSYEAAVDGKLKERDLVADSAVTLVDLGSDDFYKTQDKEIFQIRQTKAIRPRLAGLKWP